jgi:hypothetical protein
VERQRRTARPEQEWHEVPSKGDRIELAEPRLLGVHLRGTVFYADELGALVKWDDGRSDSLRTGGADQFRIVRTISTCFDGRETDGTQQDRGQGR